MKKVLADQLPVVEKRLMASKKSHLEYLARKKLKRESREIELRNKRLEKINASK